MQSDRTASIVHAIPGRVRVRLGKPLRSPEFMQSLAQAISGLEGVHQVQTNPATGSMLLQYDPRTVSLEELYQAARAADVDIALPGFGTLPDSDTEPSTVAQGINAAFGRLDSAVAGFTGGNLDAKTLVPLGLAFAALRRIAASGANLGSIPWYVLFWYSFEVFTKYNSRRRS